MNIFNKHDCKEELKKADLKSTPARVAVLKFLEESSKPVDVATILEFLAKENISADPATVFRMVNMFYLKGIIQKIELGEGKYRYEKSKDHHHHLICISCGKIEDVMGDFVSNLESQIKQNNGFLVKYHSLEFFGLCRECLSKQN